MFDPNVQAPAPEWGVYRKGWPRSEFVECRRKSNATTAVNKALANLCPEVKLYKRAADGKWQLVKDYTPAPVAPPKPIAPALRRSDFQTERQFDLMRVVLKKFNDYQKRGQVYYELEGMSTAHLTLKAMEDTKTLYAFWPKDQITERTSYGRIYHLDANTLTNVQSAIRNDIQKLADQGYIERVGNEHERRWRVTKKFKGASLA